MPLTVLAFYTRHPDFSPKDFEAYMIDRHVPLVKDIMGPLCPQTYNLRFAMRVDSGIGDRLGAIISTQVRTNADAPVMLVGSPDDLDWDAVGEMTFRDELHLHQALSVMNDLDSQRIKDDEEIFTIPEKLKVVFVGDCRTL